MKVVCGSAFRRQSACFQNPPKGGATSKFGAVKLTAFVDDAIAGVAKTIPFQPHPHRTL